MPFKRVIDHPLTLQRQRDYGDYKDMVDLVYQAPLVHDDQPDMFQRADKWEDTLVDQDAGKNSTIKRVH